MKQHVLFLTLKVFSVTGGIEKVSRVAGKALYELSSDSGSGIDIYSMYDRAEEIMEKYFPASVFHGFGGKKAQFVTQAIKNGSKASVVFLSHINLLSVGYAIKKLSPQTKIILIAHGIEVWQKLPAWKQRMLRACHLVLPVSRFTKNKMLEQYGLAESKCKVVNNCLDPFLPPLSGKEKNRMLLKQYNISQSDIVLFTLTRLSFKERYKGYDEVMMALKILKQEECSFKYLVVGKYDDEEKARLDRLIAQQGLQDDVIFTGFVPDEELSAYFNLADVYVMPSRKEGFGIVFIEALYYGKPVIAGNEDGSPDALANGELGILINPDNPKEIVAAVKTILQDRYYYLPDQAEVMKRFGYPVYKEALRQAMRSLFPLHQLPEEVPVNQKDAKTQRSAKTIYSE